MLKLCDITSVSMATAAVRQEAPTNRFIDIIAEQLNMWPKREPMRALRVKNDAQVSLPWRRPPVATTSLKIRQTPEHQLVIKSWKTLKLWTKCLKSPWSSNQVILIKSRHDWSTIRAKSDPVRLRPGSGLGDIIMFSLAYWWGHEVSSIGRQWFVNQTTLIHF